MKSLFDQVSFDCSRNVTKSYSTSFSSAVKMLAPNIRQDIYNIYGFVRFADEIVDSFHGFDKEKLLLDFKRQTFDAIEKRLNNNNTQIEFVRVDHNPDSTFPNGIPNPLLPENHHKTADIVKNVGADFGVAFDGDFDRCFFFDETGEFIPGEYLVGLFASIFLAKEPGSTIVHDPRVIWNTQDIVSQKGGKAEQSKTGHAFIKQTMRKHEAIYGGEMSAHHYFRDFAYCDSGMIPWLLIAELISLKGKSLGDLVKDRVSAYPSSGEINFTVKDANSSISSVLENFESQPKVLDEMDGYSLAFDNWRFNLRKSNTEPLVRLNIESRGPIINLESKVKEISELLNLPE